MKIQSRVSMLLATVLFSVGSAADVAKIKLRADSVKAEGAKMIGKGSAVVVTGDTTISAEHIIVDNDSGEIKCVGDAVIKIAQLTISAKDPKIESVPPVESKSLISSHTRERLTQMVLGKTTITSDPKASLLKVDDQGEKDASPTSVVVMAPVVVQEDRAPELFIRRENDVEKFFRTGTFYQSVGKKVTTKVWAKGDRGIMLSFSW